MGISSKDQRQACNLCYVVGRYLDLMEGFED